eukprot:g42062.t1
MSADGETAPAAKTEASGETTAKKDVVRADGQKMGGVVKWWNLDKGYGFLTADDGGPDVFLHQSEIQTEKFRALILGTEVEGNFQIRDGKPILLKITGRNGAKLPVLTNKLEAARLNQQQKALNEPLAPGFSAGTIKWFSPEKGYGFILPDEEGSPDIFLHKTHVRLTRVPTSGEKVHYSTKMDDKTGKKVADEVKFLTPPVTPMPGMLGLVGQGINPTMAVQMALMQQQGIPPVPAPAQAYQPYGAPPPDAYAQQSAYGAPPRAAAYGGGRPEAAYGAGAAYDPYAAAPQAGALGYYPPHTAPPVLGGGSGMGQEVGSVKFFDENKKFGFIIPNSGGRDLHFKEEQLRGPTASFTSGVQVQFNRKTAPDGKCWAENVSLAGAPAASAARPAYGGAAAGNGYYEPAAANLGKRKFDVYGAGGGVPAQYEQQPATSYAQASYGQYGGY